MRHIYYIIVLLFLLPASIKSQSEENILTLDQLSWLIKNYHPIAIQSNLILKQGENSVKKARGGFDPYLFSNFNQKYFDEKNYYSLFDVGLKIPTWYGIEVETGYDQNRGAFLNPQNVVPDGGLWYGGLNITLGKGLFIDERRATLKLAKLFAEFSVAEQQKLMNDLYFDAFKQYWKWVMAWNKYQVHKESVTLAMTRFEGVKQSYILGDEPAIDTLEAFIQVQNRQINLNQSDLEYKNATLELSNYLWYENNTPLIITDSLKPPQLANLIDLGIIPLDTLNTLLASLGNDHPELQLYDYKLAGIDIEKRLNTESLKPTINLKYNTLVETGGNSEAINFSNQNYYWGVEFGFPLFLRKERAELQLTKLKQQDTELANQQKLLELQNKLRNYYNEQLALKKQLDLYTDAVDNYNALLNGEKKKFVTGESSLFLVNSREVKFIEAKLKLAELKSKYNIARIGMIWASGTLYSI